MKTKLKYRSDFFSESKSYVLKIEKNLINAAVGKNAISFGSKITSLNLLDTNRIIYETKLNNDSDKLIRNIILEMIKTAEKSNPGVSFYAVLNFCSCFLSKKQELKKNNFQQDIKKLCSISHRTNYNNVINHINKLARGDSSFELFTNTIDNAGFNATISVDTWDGWNSKINVCSSFDFETAIPDSFLLMTKMSGYNFNNSDLLVIDGIIETVGEIHHFLERYNKNKKPLCIICRGFGEEVIATLATNFLRKTLICIPIVVPSNLNTINSLKDISIVSGADMVSSLKGDIISSIKLEQIGSVEAIKIKPTKILIKNSNRVSKVNFHIRELKNKMENETEDIRRLLEKRVLSLSPQSASIFIGKHVGETTGLIKDRLSLAFSILNSACIHGIIEIKDIPDLSINSLNSTIDKLRKINLEICPALSLIEGIKISSLTSQNIKNSGIFIVED